MNPTPGTDARICVRQCMGCMRRFDRRELTRYVRLNGRAAADPGMKIQSRGAYVCPNEKCLAVALKSGRLKTRLKLDSQPAYLLTDAKDD